MSIDGGLTQDLARNPAEFPGTRQMPGAQTKETKGK